MRRIKLKNYSIKKIPILIFGRLEVYWIKKLNIKPNILGIRKSSQTHRKQKDDE